jgi:hypothetical protein
MFVLSPGDSKVSNESSSSLKDRDFGGNRKVTRNVQKAEDYKKPSLTRRANFDGDTDEKVIAPDATMDVDDMNDPNARKRETSRRAETSTVGAANQYRRPGDADDKIYSDKENQPAGEGRADDVVKEPNPNKKHGDRNPWRIGQDRDKPADQNLGPKAPGPR